MQQAHAVAAHAVGPHHKLARAQHGGHTVAGARAGAKHLATHTAPRLPQRLAASRKAGQPTNQPPARPLLHLAHVHGVCAIGVAALQGIHLGHHIAHIAAHGVGAFGGLGQYGFGLGCKVCEGGAGTVKLERHIDVGCRQCVFGLGHGGIQPIQAGQQAQVHARLAFFGCHAQGRVQVNHLCFQTHQEFFGLHQFVNLGQRGFELLAVHRQLEFGPLSQLGLQRVNLPFQVGQRLAGTVGTRAGRCRCFGVPIGHAGQCRIHQTGPIADLLDGLCRCLRLAHHLLPVLLDADGIALSQRHAFFSQFFTQGVVALFDGSTGSGLLLLHLQLAVGKHAHFIQPFAGQLANSILRAQAQVGTLALNAAHLVQVALFFGHQAVNRLAVGALPLLQRSQSLGSGLAVNFGHGTVALIGIGHPLGP